MNDQVKHTMAPWNTVKTIGGKVYIVGANSEAVAEVTPKNAPLVAAAPDLYKALLMAREELDKLPHSLGYDFDHIPAIDRVLLKAEGDSND